MLGCPIRTRTLRTGGESAAAITAGDMTADGANQYAYDDEGRVCAVQSPAPIAGYVWTQYIYDAFGNLLQNGSFNDSYTASNQMFGYAYDAAGNLLGDGLGDVYTWDAEGRLATAGGATYIYDAIGNRVGKQGVGVTDTVFFGGKPISLYAAGQWTDLVYGPTGLLAEVPGTQNGAPVYRATDHLGSTAGTLLANGTLVNPIDLIPFGQVDSGGTNDPFVYTGLEHDAESDLEHADNREYSSTVGRWLSPDPYDGSMDVSKPQSLNRYSYVGNNPLDFTDPSGLIPLGCGFSTGSSSGGGATIVFAGGASAPPVGVAIGVIEAAACLFAGTEDIIDLFRHAKFTGTTAKRPVLGTGDFGVPYPGLNSSIAQALGLPYSGECEFGVCINNLTQGNAQGTMATASTYLAVAKIAIIGAWDMTKFLFEPSCKSLDNEGDALKVVGAAAAIYKGLGAATVATGGADLPYTGTAVVIVGGAGGVGTIEGVAAKHHVGCHD